MSIEEDDDPIATVQEQAAEWIVRQDGEALSAAEQHAFDEWMAEPGHRAAYERHRAVWGRYQALGQGKAPQRSLPQHRWRRDPRPRAWPARPRHAGAAVAAAAALAIVVYAGSWSTWLRADYATGPGERRSVTLADGSTIRLDGRSAIAFDQSDGRRTLRLLKGAATFKVAPDRAHPFTVETDVGKVTALGTAFAMRERDGAAELVVTEHSVRVETGQGRSAVVREGEATTFAPDRVAAPARADVAAATAWTRGKLIVFDRPLGEVVAVIGHQRRGYWTVRGDAAAIRVNGVYDLDHPLAALDTLEKTLKLSSFRLSDRFIVLSR